MSIGPTRWLEYWLDSVSERGYQSAFVTALALDGYEVLHSTSHGALEAGKDVIARKGQKLFAYQLKGHPGKRYGTSDWHSGYEQVVQLASMPVNSQIAGRPSPRHEPVLVTNGHIHETVHAHIQTFNQTGNLRRLNARPLSTIGRGELLSLLSKHTDAIWPTTLSAQRTILRMFSASGQEEIYGEDVIEAVLATLVWESERKPSRRLRRERALGAFLITNAMLGRWMTAGNLFEVIKAQVAALACVYCSLEKSGAGQEEISELCAVFEEQLRSNIAELSTFIAERREPLAEDILAEFAFYHQRKMLLLGVASACALHQKQTIGEVNDQLSTKLCGVQGFPFIEGEFVVPSAICFIWALHSLKAGRSSDMWLLGCLDAILARNMSDNRDLNLPSPYYGLTEVTEWKYRHYLGKLHHPLERESFRLHSWFAYPLFLMAVRRNWKRAAKNSFRDLTHFRHREMQLEAVTDFCLWRSKSGQHTEKEVGYPRNWDDIVLEATAESPISFPRGFVRCPDLLAVYCIFFPYRATPNVLLWLDRRFCETWR